MNKTINQTKGSRRPTTCGCAYTTVPAFWPTSWHPGRPHHLDRRDGPEGTCRGRRPGRHRAAHASHDREAHERRHRPDRGAAERRRQGDATRPGMPIQPTSRLAVGFSDIAKGKPQLLDEVIRSFREADSSGESWLVQIEEMRGQDVEQFRFRRLKKESRNSSSIFPWQGSRFPFNSSRLQQEWAQNCFSPYLGDLAAQNWIEWHGVWPDLRLGIHDPSLRIVFESGPIESAFSVDMHNSRNHCPRGRETMARNSSSLRRSR